MTRSHPQNPLHELFALLLWFALMVAPWGVHLLAVHQVLPAQYFWTAAPIALGSVLLWMWVGPRDPDGGLSALGYFMLWFSAVWVVAQSVIALGLFLWYGLEPGHLWLFALWVIVGSSIMFTMLSRRLSARAVRVG